VKRWCTNRVEFLKRTLNMQDVKTVLSVGKVAASGADTFGTQRLLVYVILSSPSGSWSLVSRTRYWLELFVRAVVAFRFGVLTQTRDI
jgi:hypothetical protein